MIDLCVHSVVLGKVISVLFVKHRVVSWTIELDKFHSLEQFLELLFVDVSSIRFFIFLYFVSSISCLSEPSLMSKFWKIGHFFSCLNAILTFSVIKWYFFGIFVIKHEKYTRIESNEFFFKEVQSEVGQINVLLAILVWNYFPNNWYIFHFRVYINGRIVNKKTRLKKIANNCCNAV